MKYIKGTSHFLNEGAALVGPNYDKVELEWLDNRTKPLEVLKSNNQNEVTGFDKIGTTKGGSFQVYYGLTVDPKRSEKLGSEDPVFKITMDALKSSNILDGVAAISKFISRTANKIAETKRKVDYIVPLGSTKGLSPDLAQAFSNRFKEAKVLPLGKYQFSNISSALDWEYIRDYEYRSSKGDVRSILSRVKNEILKEIDQDKTSPELIQAIRNSNTPDELRGIILRSDPKNRYYEFGSPQIIWSNPNYQIRSSGLQFGGSRRFFKTKYETPKPSGEFASPDFTKALISCILSEKTMLFVDDNTRTKEDLSRIFDVIIEIANSILPKDKASRVESEYFKRFFAYVLIYVPEGGGKKDTRDIVVKKLASETDVTEFKSDLLNFKNWIEENR